VRACASRYWPNFGGVGGQKSLTNHAWIAHEPPTNHLQPLTNHWHIAHVNAYVSFGSDSQWMSVEWTWYVRCFCVIWRWGVSGRTWNRAVSNQFWRISTDGRPTHVPRIVTHTRRKNYAHRLMNYAHRRTVVRGILFNHSKLKITHKPPSTHIHLQSMTVHVRSTDVLRIRRTLRAETNICA